MAKLNLNSIMLGTMQIDVMAKFYEEVIGKPADMVEGGWHGWSAGSCYLSVGEHSEMTGSAKDSGRVMFNFETTDVKGEFERIKAISGAKVVKEAYEMGGGWIATFADPDGNYFQLVTPWESTK